MDFTLEERVPTIVKMLGMPAHSNSGATFRTIDYNLGPEERNDEDFDWTFYFDLPSGNLITVTRNFEKPSDVSKLFDGPEVHHHSFASGDRTMPAMTRLMRDGRILIAIGMTKPAEPCSQLILMKRSAIPRFFPWIEKQSSEKPNSAKQ